MDKLKDCDRRAFVLGVLAIILGIAGVGFLAKATIELVLSGCPMNFIEVLLWGGLGLISILIDAIVLVAIGHRTRRWKRVSTALVFIAIGLIFSYFVVVPWSTEQRISRHRKRMSTIGVPLLNEFVGSIEAIREESGKIPSDGSSFHKEIEDDYHLRLVELQCCYSIDYKKVDEQHYTLRYSTMDIEYAYDSRNRVRGWHSVAQRN